VDVLLNLGILYAGNRKLDEAEHVYKKAIELDPALIEAYYNLGTFYEFYRKDTTQALAQYQQYLKLGGKDEIIRTLTERVTP